MKTVATLFTATLLTCASAQAQVYQPITTLSPVTTVAASPANIGSCCGQTAPATYAQPAPQPYYQPTTVLQPIAQPAPTLPAPSCCDPCGGFVPQTAYYAPSPVYQPVTAYRPVVSF